MRFGGCRQTIALIRCAGSLSNVIFHFILRLRKTEAAAKSGIVRKGFGKDGFGNTKLEMRRICKDVWTTRISIL